MVKFLIYIKLIPIYGIAIFNLCIFSAALFAQEKANKANKESKDTETQTLKVELPTQMKKEGKVVQEIKIQLPTHNLPLSAKQDTTVVPEIQVKNVAPLIKKANQPTIELKLEPLPKVDLAVKDTSSVLEVIELKMVPVKKGGKNQDKKEVQELKLQQVKPNDANDNLQKESKIK